MQRKLSTSTIYEGPIFTMSKDQVQAENGNTYTYDIIHHHGGAGMLVIHQNQILLISQYRPSIERTLWEIPAGKLEQGEDPYLCAVRELEEETGYQSDNIILLTSFYSTPGFCNERITIFVAQGVIAVPHPKAMDEDEWIEVKWFSLPEIRTMLAQGDIEDAKTIIALQYALLSRI